MGEVVPEENIESYFVWIPRYKYKIFNEGNYNGYSNLNPDAPQTIEIEFESKDTIVSSGSTVGEWLTHPAFTSFGSNGIWVGKFESGYKNADSISAAEVSTADSTKLIVKPNTYSWRNINVGNMFKTSYDYARHLESHMMKNTEWGAVAYLFHSKYGKQDENGDNSEIYVNSNYNYITGCGGDSADETTSVICKDAYNSKEDNICNQSTTGNISGIFDMSGGAYEYVMGYNIAAVTVGRYSGITDIYENFFTDGEKWSKYYDLYDSDSVRSYNSRILGDATGEMGPFADGPGRVQSSWYSDYAQFVYPVGPWFHRGGKYYDGYSAGIFNFGEGTGGAHSIYTFRVVLSPDDENM